MDTKMCVVIIEPNQSALISEIGSDLKSMQEVVGGHIEIIPAERMIGGNILRNRDLLLVLNEEGKNDGSKPNFPTRDGLDYIFGTVFICKGQEDEMVGLSEEEADLVAGLVHRKEETDG